MKACFYSYASVDTVPVLDLSRTNLALNLVPIEYGTEYNRKMFENRIRVEDFNSSGCDPSIFTTCLYGILNFPLFFEFLFLTTTLSIFPIACTTGSVSITPTMMHVRHSKRRTEIEDLGFTFKSTHDAQERWQGKKGFKPIFFFLK